MRYLVRFVNSISNLPLAMIKNRRFCRSLLSLLDTLWRRIDEYFDEWRVELQIKMTEFSQETCDTCLHFNVSKVTHFLAALAKTRDSRTTFLRSTNAYCSLWEYDSRWFSQRNTALRKNRRNGENHGRARERARGDDGDRFSSRAPSWGHVFSALMIQRPVGWSRKAGGRTHAPFRTVSEFLNVIGTWPDSSFNRCPSFFHAFV